MFQEKNSSKAVILISLEFKFTFRLLLIKKLNTETELGLFFTITDIVYNIKIPGLLISVNNYSVMKER